MHRYRVGPLRLQSRMAIPELQPVARASSEAWTFRVSHAGAAPARGVAWFHDWTFPNGRRWLMVGRLGRRYVVRFARVASFLIDPPARTITAFPGAGVPARTIRHLLLDQVVPMLLGDADHLVVHASAVVAGGGAVAFIGPSGSGKSTLAGALARHGCALVTDDCLVVDLGRRPAHVIPTYAGLRLWPDVLRALFPGERRRTAGVAHYSSKRRVRRHTDDFAFRRRPEPLRAACVLTAPASKRSPVSKLSMTRLRGHEAFAAVLRCTFHLDVGRETTARRALERVTAMLETVPVFRLQMPRDLARLDEVGVLMDSLAVV
ncbi:MAG: hypothetical protein HY048_17550 [Acidobacteria bacterium]|nr:hypothetical protein [Acidobacteriota bacterium]